VLRGEASSHRDAVFVEYAQNDEACIRTERYKLIYERGKRKRTDGYDPGRPLPGPTLRLYDLKADPQEMKSLAKSPEHEKLTRELTDRLVAHLKRTARQVNEIPETTDPLELLEYLVQPRDVMP
jgi:choline-sulfatase